MGQSAVCLESLGVGGLPVVVVDRYFPQLRLPYVISDNYQGTVDAMTYLIERGHKAIVCVQGLANTWPNRERVRGYRESLSRCGILVDDSLVVGDSFSEEHGYVCAKLLLNKGKKITAILALSNTISLGILRALSEEGVKVPDDVSVICFDDQPYCAYLNPPLTTVHQNNAEMGQIAVKLLLAQMQSTHTPIQEGIVLPTRLIERASVRLIGK